jgi:hypothetical protein
MAGREVRILGAVPGQMYDPAVQRALLERLARWRQLPEGDLIAMLSPVERLRYRPEALDDLEWDGLVSARVAGDERVLSITEAGDEWLRNGGAPRGPSG